MTMSANGSEVLKCFNCDARFDNPEEFWDHIYNVDCGGGGTNLSFPKENFKPASPVVGPDLQEKTDESRVLPAESPIDHGEFACGLCNQAFDTSSELHRHTQSSEHRERITSAATRYITASNPKKGPNKWLGNGPQQPLFCEDCQVPLPSLAAREAHITGKKHQKTMAQKSRPGQNTISGLNDVAENNRNEEIAKPHLYCEFCQLTLSDRQAATIHLNSATHLAAMRKQTGQGNDSVNISVNKAIGRTDSVSPHLTPLAEANLTELNTLLRRLCLTQLLALMRGMDGGNTEPDGNNSYVPTRTDESGINEHHLLQLFRAICREELQNLLASCNTSPSRFDMPKRHLF